MKSISATPENIATIFGSQKHYIIPEFQRPYSWKEDEVVQFFEDVTSFYDDIKHAPQSEMTYYLGNIVYFKENDAYVIIDGQQRLTTIALFIKALFSSAKTATTLEKCLKKVDPLTSELVDEIKIESRVINSDREELLAIIINDSVGDGLLSDNYNILCDLLKQWIEDKRLSAKNVGEFILYFLNNVLLLPILCETQDDALTIFDTLNNRGLPLNDQDIFKAQIFKNIDVEEDKQKFILEWNDISENSDIDDLFKFLMHIDRAKNNIVTKEIRLRKYFSIKNKNEDFFSDWQSVIDSLKKIHDPLLEYEGGINEETAFLDNLWKSLILLPHTYCFYPPYVFWAKHANLINGASVLPKKQFKEFKKLLTRTIKFYFVYAISTNSVNTVKDITFKVCADMWHDRAYEDNFKMNYKDNFKIFESKLEDYRQYKKYRKGLAYLLAVWNTNQDQIEFQGINKKLDLEHILPRNGYNNYNGWTREQYLESLDSIGNLVVFEKKLNIKASNEFFAKKKEEYKISKIVEAKELTKKGDWTFRIWQNRQKEKKATLIRIFKTLR